MKNQNWDSKFEHTNQIPDKINSKGYKSITGEYY